MTTIQRPLFTGSGWRCLDGNDVPMFYNEEVESLEQAIYDLLSEVRAVIGGPGSTITQMLGASAQQQQQIAVYTRGAAALGLLGSMIAPEVGVPLALGAEVIAIANELDLGGDVDVPADMPVNTTAGIRDGTYPVTPITPPPEGYGGGGTPQDVAEAVWAYQMLLSAGDGGGWNAPASAHVEVLSAFIASICYGDGLPDRRTAWFRWHAVDPSAMMTAWYDGSPEAWMAVPALDFSALRADDTVLSFLQREYPAWTWTTTAPVGHTGSTYVWATALPGLYPVYLRCTLTDPMLALLFQAEPATTGAPVWPGIDNVTLDDPYPISGDTEVEVPMDGCLIALTTVPGRYSGWGLPGEMSRYRVGYISFRTDNGEWEPHQYLEFEQGLYCPKSMRQASSVVVHCSPGVEGTVTPYLATT